MRKLISMLFLIMAFLPANQILAQVNKTTNVTNEKNYWQIAPRAGYDFPLYDEDFKFIKYKGGISTGLSVNKYWNWAGFQFDFDYMQNAPTSDNIPNPLYFLSGVTPSEGNLFEAKKDINRMFLGIGPAFKYQSQNNRFTMDFAALIGMGSVKGGEYVSLVQDKAALKFLPITYHIGFNGDWGIAAKTQLRFNYFLNQSKTFGLHAGVYYLTHFGITEDGNRELLTKYLPGSSSTLTFYEAGTSTIRIDGPTGEIIDVEAINGQGDSRGTGVNEADPKKINVASLGVFAGVSFRIFKGKNAESQCPEGQVWCEVHNACHNPPACCATCPTNTACTVSITAKDKFTGQILPNTDVVLNDATGAPVKTGTTNSMGIVIFENVKQANYSIAGKLLNVNLEPGQITDSEFASCIAASKEGSGSGTLQKEIIYSDTRFILEGKVVECNTANGLQGVNVQIDNLTAPETKTTMTDSNGEFTFHVNQASQYSIIGNKSGYFSNKLLVTTNSYDRNKTLKIDFELCANPCDKAIKLDNINFDLDKSNIKPQAEPDLLYIVKLMNDNPSIKVEMSSHTDSRGSAAYNQALSQRRADSTVNWLVQHGVSRNRLIAKGAGESELLNNCSDGVTCTEAEHAINRRTEFKIICPE